MNNYQGYVHVRPGFIFICKCVCGNIMYISVYLCKYVMYVQICNVHVITQYVRKMQLDIGITVKLLVLFSL